MKSLSYGLYLIKVQSNISFILFSLSISFDIFLDKGGVNHDKIDKFLTNEDFEFCETTYVDVDTADTNIEYQGSIVKEDDDIKCDSFEPEFKDTIIPFNKRFGRHA